MNLGPFRRLSSFGRLPSRVRARVGVVGLAVDPSWCGDDRVVGAVDPEALVTFDLPRPSVVVVAGWDANIATFVARAARPAVIVVSDDPAASQGWANERCRVAERPEDVGRHLSTLIREEWRFFLEPSEILRWYAHDVRNALFAPSMATDELRTAEVITGDLAEDVEAIDEGIRRTLGMTYAMSALGVSWARTRVKPQPAQVGLAGTFEDAATAAARVTRMSTSRPRCRATSATHREVSQAQGHTGSQKNSTSAGVAASLIPPPCHGRPPLRSGAARSGSPTGRAGSTAGTWPRRPGRSRAPPGPAAR